MSLEPWPPEAERPRWRRPGSLEIGLGVVVFVAGLAGALIPDKVAQLPSGLRWGLFVGPLLATLIWVSRMAYQEITVVRSRVQEYPKLYALAENERRRADQERALVHGVTRTLTTLALHPERALVVAFEMVESVVSDEDVLLAIEAAEDLTPDPGTLLTVVDPQDGKRLGELEATNLRTVDGKCLARVVEWDAVFLGHVRDKAERRESLQLRARAFYVVLLEDTEGN